MYKNASYKEKHATLKNWMPAIISAIKSDLKNDHLKLDSHFTKQYFPAKNLQKISLEDMVEAYNQAIAKEPEAEKIAEFIASRWMLKNADVYHVFEQELSKLADDFTQLEEINTPQSRTIIQAAEKQFGPSTLYIFSVFNSVVFSPEAFQELKYQAEQESKKNQALKKEEEEQLIEKRNQESFEREILRLTDKYEKKLVGLQKKYLVDTEALKKQVASLQRKLATT